MAALADMRSFFRMLEQSSVEELTKKQEALIQLRRVVKTRNVLSDINYLLRHIEEELMSRLIK